jgi:hypothetical protein
VTPNLSVVRVFETIGVTDEGEARAHLCLTFSGLRVVLQAAICDSLLFDPFAFEEDGLAAPGCAT